MQCRRHSWPQPQCTAQTLSGQARCKPARMSAGADGIASAACQAAMGLWPWCALHCGFLHAVSGYQSVMPMHHYSSLSCIRCEHPVPHSCNSRAWQRWRLLAQLLSAVADDDRLHPAASPTCCSWPGLPARLKCAKLPLDPSPCSSRALLGQRGHQVSALGHCLQAALQAGRQGQNNNRLACFQRS